MSVFFNDSVNANRLFSSFQMNGTPVFPHCGPVSTPTSSSSETSDLPTRRQSLNRRVSPYPSPSADMASLHPNPPARPTRPGMSKPTRPRPGLGRTVSFCPTAPGQGYVSASQSSTSTTPGRLSKPLVRLSSGEVVAPTMQRSLSSLGIDGYRLNRDGERDQEASGAGSGSVSHESSRPSTPATRDGGGGSSLASPAISLTVLAPVPTITIDSPDRTLSQSTFEHDVNPYRLPIQSTPTPGFEGYSPSFSDYSTPGPSTPYVPLLLESERREKGVSSGKGVDSGIEGVSKGVEGLSVSVSVSESVAVSATRRGSAATV